ncbi:WXG100 family type VII secretion target [Nocardia sp.]|uniref:WXG100 family type VII secretion target n=1 Tax=Nocardia sp. TaxID=1821 RepID=UPI00262F4650|nr:hypothetical protein [Nocardia sp.]
MGDTFQLDPNEFGMQAPAFGNASDELAAALRHLQSAIDTEGQCWGSDEPGHQFAKTYQPDANQTVQNVQTLVQILQYTGSQIKTTADTTGVQDLTNGRSIGNSGNPGGLQPSGLTSAPQYNPSAPAGAVAPAANPQGSITAPGDQSNPGLLSAAPISVTPQSMDGQGPVGSGPADQPGGRGYPTAAQALSQPGNDTGGGPAPDTVSPSLTTDTAPTTEPDPLGADDNALDPGSAPFPTGGARTENAPGVPPPSRSSSAVPGSAPSRSPWSGGSVRRPDKKRKEDKKPRKELPKVSVALDVDRSPSVDAALLDVTVPTPRSDALRSTSTPWSQPGAADR